jgi:hypothetical protein
MSMAMADIFRTNAHDLPWVDYNAAGVANGHANVRVKPLTVRDRDVPPMQFVDYAPGHTDPVHSHDTEYAVRAGAEGVRYFRVVFPT